MMLLISIPNIANCWFIQSVAVALSVSMAFSTPILAISSSCLDFSFKSKLSSNFELICCWNWKSKIGIGKDFIEVWVTSGWT